MPDRSYSALLERRDAALAATPGPWKTMDGGDTVITAHIPERKRIRVENWTMDNDFVCNLDDGEYHEYLDENESHANARHIAMSDPQTVVADIDEILALRRENESLRQAIFKLGMVMAKPESEVGHV